MSLVLANNIKVKRKQMGLTQQIMSNLLNLERSTYAYYETGKTSPSLETLAKLAELFGCTIEELLKEPEILLREEAGFTLKENPLDSIRVAKRLIDKISQLPLNDRLQVEDLVDELLDKNADEK